MPNHHHCQLPKLDCAFVNCFFPTKVFSDSSCSAESATAVLVMASSRLILHRLVFVSAAQSFSGSCSCKTLVQNTNFCSHQGANPTIEAKRMSNAFVEAEDRNSDTTHVNFGSANVMDFPSLMKFRIVNFVVDGLCLITWILFN